MRGLLLLTVCAVLSINNVVATSQARCLLDRKEIYPKHHLTYEEKFLNLTLAVSNRVSHQLTTHVFKIFMSEVLGYPNVQIVHLEDHFDPEIAFEGLVPPRGDNHTSTIPKSLINLEVWVPPELDVSRFAAYREVTELGPLMAPGRFGWFVPITLNSINTTSSWDQFKSSQAGIYDIVGANFNLVQNAAKDVETGEYFCSEDFCIDGMYTPMVCERRGESCALMLAPSYEDTSFIVKHINELNLHVKVIWLGKQLNETVQKLIQRYNSENSNNLLLVLSWTPNDIIDTTFKSILIPKCEEEETLLYSGCKYEMSRLVKFSWSKLEHLSKSHIVLDALRQLNFYPNNIRHLLNMYKEDSSKSFDDIACAWMRMSETYWNRWLTKQPSAKENIYIGGIFPLSGSSYKSAHGIVKAAEMAQNAINHNDSILSDYNLVVLANDGQCKPDIVLKIFIDYIIDNFWKSLVGVLGPACSDTVEPLAGVSKHFSTMVISYSAEGASFSDRVKYPYFFRTIGENKQYRYVYLQLLKKFGWKKVGALTEDGQKYSEYILHIKTLLLEHGIEMTLAKFPQEREKTDMRIYLEELKTKRAKIIIADVYDSAARSVMCEAYHLKMTAKEGYVWFLPLWLAPDWYNTTHHNARTGENITCSTEDMVEAINGHFAIAHAYYGSNETIMQENISVKQWREHYADNCTAITKENAKKNLTNVITTSEYGGYAYDAVWTYALALDKLFKENAEYLVDLHSLNTTLRLVDIVKETDFNGVSGRIKFRGGPSRFSVVNIYQRINNSTYTVGSFYPNISNDRPEVIGGTLDLNLSSIVWLSGGIPEDGSKEDDTCAFASIANAFNIECGTAIVLVNVIAVGLLIIVLTAAVFIYKKRYEEKLKLSQKYMKSFGIDLNNIGGLDKWEIPRDHVVINRKLGEGAFGTVYGGEAQIDDKGWTAVAVKTLKVGSNTEEKLDFLSEAESMKRFDHKNIVKLLGVCTKNEPVYTIMEFMLYGDLKTFLLARRHLVNEKQSEETDEISSKKLTQMALDVASALSYLAELKYVHRDVASRNCLVNASRVVKLGDFGMTRPMFENEYYKFNRKGMLPVRWMAPESLGQGIFTPSSDIWSYGVVLYEIITFGSFPFQGMNNNQVLDHVKNGNTLKIPQGIKPQLEGLIKSCWNIDYKTRPHASEIVDFLANYPRLLSPSLDVPLASVQMADDSFELNPDTFNNRFSPSPSGTLSKRSSFVYSDNNGQCSTTTYRTAVLEPLIKNNDKNIVIANNYNKDYKNMSKQNSNGSFKQILNMYNVNSDKNNEEEEDNYVPNFSSRNKSDTMV